MWREDCAGTQLEWNRKTLSKPRRGLRGIQTYWYWIWLPASRTVGASMSAVSAAPPHDVSSWRPNRPLLFCKVCSSGLWSLNAATWENCWTLVVIWENQTCFSVIWSKLMYRLWVKLTRNQDLMSTALKMHLCSLTERSVQARIEFGGLQFCSFQHDTEF